ncbi:DUF732 domain-containing protein [Mycobacterium bourgelatii]|uniref:DUF732 domain-containing protein n=1 Tax=Mycobacterium bourgelatii TaxID=1273442 RepID=A0A7I9YHC8_MYCBU|nr:DUF732 domain-containing protein [Mycobacterium bourgelatii]MCV6975320.1 DUF732 domain-containing protein [Mycobacterium bourgelatii]GFG88091.1 hypothetical protein MBOU_01330 [Mycobacterium bourgelatii]
MSSILRFVAPSLVALATGAVLCSPTASADANSFLSELRTNNVMLPGKTPDQVVAAGYQTCSDLRGGASVLDEMSKVEKQYGISNGTLFVSAATTNLCPDFAG